MLLRPGRVVRVGVPALSRSVTTAAGEEVFDKILIANRGEIACRVIRTARQMGIKTVAVYSEPDAHALHVRSADEAVCVGPAASADSYLRTDRILEAVHQTGAQAVHPGYGFLSENHLFAEALEKDGVSFIGPPSPAITAMGDKIESKLLAESAKVNIIPGVNALVETDEEVIDICKQVGYPVMIKASAGGGGKGMRIAYNDEEAVEGFRLSREEAKASFGDDRIFIEKFIEDPRHIEIQLLADKHGNAVGLPERECSIQRRNQKVIEEAPSVLLDDETRAAMQEQACRLAKAVGYHSAGTVEFLVDKHLNFYFLEMNTRLQVEHPITEWVTGIDLVEQMIRIAAGYPIPDHILAGVPINGWAMESRVYAEDPLRGFLPSTGRLEQYVEPASGEADPQVRVDTGIVEGSEISMYYDPLICKLVTHGATRQDSIDKMVDALDSYVIRGLGHNVNFLRDVYVDPRFTEGRLTTGYIAEEYPDGFHGVELTPSIRHNMASVAAVMARTWVEVRSSIEDQVEYAGFVDADEFVITVGGTAYNVSVLDSDDFSQTKLQVAAVDGSEEPTVVTLNDVAWNVEDPLLVATRDDGSTVRCQHLARLPEGFSLQFEGAVADVIVRTPREEELAAHMIPKPEKDYSKLLISPMPGTLVSIEVEVGQEVEAGQELCVVEAMKMQNILRAPKKGKVAKVCHVAGDTLAVDETIIEFE